MSQSMDLLDLLERRAQSFGPEPPTPVALERVLGRVKGRRRRRGVVASTVAVALVGAAMVGVQGLANPPQRLPFAAVQAANPLVGTVQSLAVRQSMGIFGATKGAPDSVLVRQAAADGHYVMKLVEVTTGKATTLDLPADTSTASVSPGGRVAAVTETHLVVSTSKDQTRTETIPQTGGAQGPVSWAPGGTALFVRVHGGWVRVSSSVEVDVPGLMVQPLDVPKLPGGPMLLSVSPTGAEAVLFGVTEQGAEAPIPHLYVGRFDGAGVTDVRALPIPPGAIDGPMGWVGDNAFLLAPAPNRALIVRTDGTWTLVEADTMEDPCSLVPAGARCVSKGPWLLGTNVDGSLLFWRLDALPLPHVSDTDALVTLYYRTWLDGTHPAKLTGASGKYGPPCAPR
jgi:hypothetical protein